MVSSKIFWYELKRTVFTKAYAFLLLLILLYAVYVLKTSVVMGVDDTAPFSLWTFISYLLTFVPLLQAILLFFAARLFSPHENDVEKVTSSMPFSGSFYRLIKISVIAIAYIAAVLAIVIAGSVFYGWAFGFFDLREFAVCVSLILIAPLFFMLGLGLLLGEIRHTLAYVLLAVVFLFSFLNFSPACFFDVFGYSLMRIPGKAIPKAGIIPFIVPGSFWATRAAFAALGLLMIGISCMNGKPKRQSVILKTVSGTHAR